MKYFLDWRKDKIYMMIGELLEYRKGERLVKGTLFSMNDFFRNPKIIDKNKKAVFYNGFDTFEELQEYVLDELDRKKRILTDNMKDAKYMYKGDLCFNKQQYMHFFNSIKNNVRIQKKDYKHIEILRDLAIQCGVFEDDSDYFITFNNFDMSVKAENKDSVCVVRYEKYNLPDINELYNYLERDLKVKMDYSIIEDQQ